MYPELSLAKEEHNRFSPSLLTTQVVGCDDLEISYSPTSTEGEFYDFKSHECTVCTKLIVQDSSIIRLMYCCADDHDSHSNKLSDPHHYRYS